MAYDNDELKIIPERDSLAPSRSTSNSSGNGVLWGAVAILVAGVGGLYFQNTQLSQALSKQEGQVSQALNRIQVLEQELTATGRDLSKSGATLENRIQGNETEIRKLWDLSNKRNRRDIDDNSTAIAALKAQLSKIPSELSNLQQVLKDESTTRTLITQALKTEQELLSTQIANQQIALTEQANAQQLALTQHAETDVSAREELKALLESKLTVLQQEYDELTAQMKALEEPQDSLGEVNKTIQEHKLRLDSIDASRRQLTTNVTRLNTDVSNLQLEVNALMKGNK